VIQVGDRRVTQRETPGAPARIFDPQSNKQVVFLCDDAVAVVGYSGAAFLDELPTDHVIAEALADRQMRYRNGPVLAIRRSTAHSAAFDPAFRLA
jgi:hypothetical protein